QKRIVQSAQPVITFFPSCVKPMVVIGSSSLPRHSSLPTDQSHRRRVSPLAESSVLPLGAKRSAVTLSCSALHVPTSLAPAVSTTRIVGPLPPTATSDPSGEKARALTLFSAVNNKRTSLPVRGSTNRTRWSS